jgi:DNA-binding PadR family transcriptional regulator
MSLKHALLGFLSYQPMTGYELKQRFDQSVHHFWSANLSQIYPTLSRMEKEGLLTVETEYQEDRPNRKVYYMTDIGRKELLFWLREPMDLSPTRMAFLIKIFFGVRLEQEEILTQLRQHLALHQERLAAYQGAVWDVLQQSIEATGLEREGFFWSLTLEAGIQFEQGWIEWCEKTIEKIESMDKELWQ